MIPSVPTHIQTSRPFLEAQIRQRKAEIGILEEHLKAHLERGEQEIHHITSFCISQGYHPAGPYLSSIASDYKAKADLIRLDLAKQKGELMLYEATLAQSEKKVAVPGSF